MVRAQSLASLLDKPTPGVGAGGDSNAKRVSMSNDSVDVGRRIKGNVIDMLNELIDELGSIRSQIAEQVISRLVWVIS
jgi:hypothetical protein